MSSLSKNYFIKAFVTLMVVSALLHILILLYVVITTKNVNALNFFTIIELDIFFPHFVHSSTGNYIAAILVALIYLTSYIFLSKKK